MDLDTALRSIKTALDIGKMLYSSSNLLADAETKQKMANLISALTDAEIGSSRLRTLLLEKEEVIAELTDRLKVKKNLRYEQPSYWLVEGDYRDGPFCQRCWDADNKLIRVLDEDGDDYHRCRACHTNYRKHGRIRESRRRSDGGSWMTI